MAGFDGDKAVATVGQSKMCRCACVSRWLPLPYREELYEVLKLTGPLVLSRILNFLLPFVVTIFCGHIGNSELAGYALASALINVTTCATGFGLALACDTLISQTYGGKNLQRVGVILQRSSMILLLFSLPCCGILINSYNILIVLQQQDEVARIAQKYLMAFLPAVPAMFLHQLQVAYLQNQGIILPQMYTAAAANIINLGVNYVLIVTLQLGLTGSVIANSLSQITICLLLFGYIRWKKLHQKTWGGWSTDCLQDWGGYMKLAVPSCFMICFEWWIWEIGGFLAGILGESDIAAQHILLEIGALTYMFPLGINAATCVRVGNALGAGDTDRALLTCKVSLSLSVIVAVLQGIIIAGSKSVLGYIFTSDDHIVAIVTESSSVYMVVQFFDAILCVCGGILVGVGMQKMAAVIHLVGYYVIGLPMGAALMFPAGLRILGLWLGLLTSNVLEAGFFLLVIFKIDWQKVTQKAQKRAGKMVISILKPPVGTVMNEGLVSEASDCFTSAPLESDMDSKADGYSPVSTQDHGLKAGPGAEVNHSKAAGTEADPEQNKQASQTKPEELLSVTQLMLRRGVILLISVLILVISVAFHFAFPVPEPSVQSISNSTLNWANVSTPTLTPLDL